MKISSFFQLANPLLARGQAMSGVQDGPAGSGPGGNEVSLDDAAFVVFDTELTGLNPKKDSIVSIGAVRMKGKRILLGETFYRVVEPRTPITAQSVVIHEIMPVETKSLPEFEALLPEFLDFCGSAVVVGHVVSIDLAFLNREMKHLYGDVLQNRAVDTSRLYQWIRKREEDACAFRGGLTEPNDLFSLAKKYQIPVKHAHHALGDAFVTAQLLQRLLHNLPRWGVRTVQDLLRIASP
jgi:DNA polymerase-3 subunit epsilon